MNFRDKSIEIIQIEEQAERRLETMAGFSDRGQYQVILHMCNWYLRRIGEKRAGKKCLKK